MKTKVTRLDCAMQAFQPYPGCHSDFSPMFGTGPNDPPGCTFSSGATFIEYGMICIIRSFTTPTEDSGVTCLLSQPKYFLAPMQPQRLTARCAPIVANICVPIPLSIRAPQQNFGSCREVTPRWSELRSRLVNFQVVRAQPGHA